MTDLIDHAIAYDNAGWVVIPMKSGTKKAVVKWKEITEPDPVRTVRYWTWRPDSSIGVLCGPSRLIVVDVDAPDAEKVLPPLPETATVTTGRGRHHIYRARSGVEIRNTTGRVPVDGEWVDTPNVDIRATGGLFVAPPSLHKSGVRYRWDTDADLSFAPSWLLPPEQTVTRNILWSGTDEASAARVAALLNVASTATEGERNSCLNWAAYQMRELVAAGTITEDGAVGVLVRSAAVAGLDTGEAEATALSGLRAELVGP